VNYSAAASSVAERNKNALQEIGRRISDMGIMGLTSHTARKLLTNFNDGTFAWGREGEFYWNIQEKHNGLAQELRDYYYDSGSNYPVFSGGFPGNVDSGALSDCVSDYSEERQGRQNNGFGTYWTFRNYLFCHAL